MAPTLGKRKRSSRTDTAAPQALTAANVESADSASGEDFQDIFRRAFEKRFAPLPREAQKPGQTSDNQNADTDSSGSDDSSHWSGLSDTDADGTADNVIEVVHHGVDTPFTDQSLSRAEARSFLTSKPPLTMSRPANPKKSGPTDDDSDNEPEEKANLKNDLALHRLISESHLLEASRDGRSSQHRRAVTEMRLKALGSKASTLEQEKMPLSHRKGIKDKARQREQVRRTEAKENGVILEKAAYRKKAEAKRERGVGGPGIGKFKGGTLQLSQKDIKAIKGSGRKR